MGRPRHHSCMLSFLLTLQQSSSLRCAKPLVGLVASLLYTVSTEFMFTMYRIEYTGLEIIRITLIVLLLAALVGLVFCRFPSTSRK